METNESTPLLHPRHDVRRRLGNIGNTTFHRLVADGELRVVHVGRRVFVTETELKRFISSLEQRAAA